MLLALYKQKRKSKSVSTMSITQSHPTIMDRIKSLALDEIKTIRTLVQDGLRSGAYTYPFQVKNPPFPFRPYLLLTHALLSRVSSTSSRTEASGAHSSPPSPRLSPSPSS
ncbi:hypothetical protein CISG_07298 [Coccidioides immitis RMSCC 3703]|uniref:Uncharacterized protein n=1 Tax=Coccidioides immitis RMSCC 3703 TaxID=454286 RepID=A0A0J8TYT8_COCIT|nr:hypothetical protein CISG_07298 [Coccidioides immitis RMSCC 3703]